MQVCFFSALKGRTILITGSSRGIGLAIAKKVAADGANIIVTGRTVEPKDGVNATIFTAAEESTYAENFILQFLIIRLEFKASRRFNCLYHFLLPYCVE